MVCAMMPSLNSGCQEQLANGIMGFCLERFLMELWVLFEKILRIFKIFALVNFISEW
jgi:hypothetical protein